MGQTRSVLVHRLVAQNSIETSIVEMTGVKARDFDELVRRSSLAEATVASGDAGVDTRRLLAEEQRRLGLPPTAA
jgi:hypothetical protein